MHRILVVYASKHGSTHEIASYIAEELRAHKGVIARCVSAKEVGSIEADAVVLGSAVYMGRWRREARNLLHDHAEQLAGLPFWVFSSGPVGDPAEEDEGTEHWLEPRDTIEEAERLGVRDHVVFGGTLPEHPGVFGWSMAKNTPEEFRDRRDWDEIRAWADAIATDLGAPERVPV